MEIIGALIAFFSFYFLPAILGYYRKHNNRHAIFATNLFLGWLVLGWIASLIWALTGNVKRENI